MIQKDLAIKLGITDKAVSKWERGLDCQDVSILELLNGKKMEKEAVSVLEANDYLKTIKESLDKKFWIY